ncbi:MAG: Gfo/Idh/MocA family oxidoreductase [Planctomycetia bacterium]|nr:Gfo/Idh/MocA family oxidoreductase [Planctomycetia bacterium]
MNPLSRRSFLATSAVALAVGGLTETRNEVRGAEESGQIVNIPGFDQTRTDYDPLQKWEPYTDRKVRVGIAGHGACKFGVQFYFQTHPNVEVVAVTDLFPDRCAEMAKIAKCEKTYPSLEEMVKDDSIEAIFCATDAPAHADHAILCLEHGKHVATAVPAFMGNEEDGFRLFECVQKHPELTYAMFETSCFHADLYAMEKLYTAGVFGRLIYTEGEYHHPHILGHAPIASYKGWRTFRPPLWYPTHASAYYIGVTHKSLTEVSCQGFVPFDEVYRNPDKNGNPFSMEVGMFRTSEGGIARIVYSQSQGEYIEGGRVRGEFGGYNGRFIGDPTATKRYEQALDNGLKLLKYALPPGVEPGGHEGSHGYLGHDFIDSILRKRKPCVDIYDALNMTMPGFYAHRSALKDGETLKIPQFLRN